VADLQNVLPARPAVGVFMTEPQIMVKPILRSIMIYLLMRADLANAMEKPCLHTTKPSTMEIAAACVRVARTTKPFHLEC